jgi:hypothetical protein
MHYNSIEKTLAPERLAEMDVMLADPDISYEQVAKEYGTTGKTVAKRAMKIGAPERAKHNRPRKTADVAPAKNLRMVDAQLEALAAKSNALKAEIDRLRQLREELSLRFEQDGDDVLVFGVDITTGQAMRATATDWLRFLNVDGGRKLREFCTTALKTVKEAHHGKA